MEDISLCRGFILHPE